MTSFTAGSLALEAAQLLDTTERTVTRMSNKIKRQGIAGIKHGNSWKTPANKTSSTLLSKAIQKYEKDYIEMNVTHALEYLQRDEEFKNLKYEVFRHKLKSKGLVVKRNLRVRSSSEGTKGKWRVITRSVGMGFIIMSKRIYYMLFINKPSRSELIRTSLLKRFLQAKKSI